MQMRLNKVSELIHNSTNHQNLDSAGVSVYFQEIVDLVISFLSNYLLISSYVLFHISGISRIHMIVISDKTPIRCRMMERMKLFQELIL